MEVGALLLILVSAAMGVALRNHVSMRVARGLLVIGFSVLLVGMGTFALLSAGQLSVWGGALYVALVAFVVAMLVLPLALALTLRLPRSGGT